MLLGEYLEKQNLSQEAFGKLVGVSRVQINRLVQRRRTPSFKLLKKIEEVTEGMVSSSDFSILNEVTNLKNGTE